MEVISEHTVDLNLIPHLANILDIGCLGFGFDNHFTHDAVYNIDISEFPYDHHRYHRLAISDKCGLTGVNYTNDKQATHIKEGNEIPMMTISAYSKMVGVKHWDLIKMDIEGEEIKVLREAKHPMATQVSVEFHAHINQTKEQIDELLLYLSNFYTIHNQVWESRHGAGFNYWDVLMIKK